MSGKNWKRNEEKLKKKNDLTALLHPGQKRRHQVPCISGVSWDSYLLLPEFCIILCFPAWIFVLPECCVFWISVFLLTVAWVGVCRPLVGVGFPRTLRHIHVLRSPGPRVSPENQLPKDSYLCCICILIGFYICIYVCASLCLWLFSSHSFWNPTT